VVLDTWRTVGYLATANRTAHLAQLPAVAWHIHSACVVRHGSVVQPQLISPSCLVAAAKEVPVHLCERSVVCGRWLEAVNLQATLRSGLVGSAAAALECLFAVVADAACPTGHCRHGCVEPLVGCIKLAKRNTVKLLLQAGRSTHRTLHRLLHANTAVYVAMPIALGTIQTVAHPSVDQPVVCPASCKSTPC
jgi:hypothetical protein